MPSGFPEASIIIGGRKISAPAGEPLDIAVLKTRGFTGLSMSMKYRRPRYPYCHHEWCPGNEAVVNGRLVRATETYVRQGIRVAEICPQSSRILSMLHGMLDPGFYHSFYVRLTWPVARRLIVKAAGLPSFGEVAWSEPRHSRLEHVETDVLVVGGGVSGLRAAVHAARNGASVFLVEAGGRMGGRHGFFEKDLVGRLLAEARERGVRILSSTAYLGRFPEGYVAVEKPHRRLLVINAGALIYAGGSIDALPIMGNNDLPGIVSSEYALRITGYGYKPRRAVILTSRHMASWALRIASVLLSRGTHVSIVSRNALRGASLPREAEVYDNVEVYSAYGGCRVEGLKLSTGEKIKADMVVSAIVRHPLIHPLLQLGAAPAYCRRSGTLVALPPPGVFVAGDAGGECIDAGDAASVGELAAEHSRGGEAEQRLRDAVDPGSIRVEDVAEWMSGRIRGMQFICLCSDVTLEDLVDAYSKGYRDMEKIKRFTALGTGPCQGKICMITAARVLSKITGASLADIGFPRQRAPLVPVEVSLLGAEA